MPLIFPNKNGFSMSKMRSSLLAAIGAIVLAGPVWGQQAPTEALTLHPGDKITWTVSGPHRVQFGGTVAGTALTLLGDVRNVLVDIDPPIPDEATETFKYPAGQTVTATVAPLPEGSAEAELNFTCGFGPHTAIMVTRPFKIVAASEQQAAGDVQIRSAPPTRWLMATDGGDVLLGGQ